MKYYIGYPISFNCNLRCSYCYNQEFFKRVDTGKGENKWHSRRTFSFEDYRRWRDKHLSDGTDFIMHLFGGEPFCKQNSEDVFDIISFMNKERIDILTNGIGERSTMEKLKDFNPERFNRIGFTFHRKIMMNNPKLCERFKENVLLVKSMGYPVYVKELLLKEYRDSILSNKKYWLSQCVEFKVQDFKGEDKGISQEEYEKYTPIDHLLIDPEYKHGNPCSCINGYKNLFIRGFDMADVWSKGADVIACWQDPTVIGNILEDWYCSSGIVVRKADGGMEVKFATKIYRGTNEKDLPIKIDEKT